MGVGKYYCDYCEKHFQDTPFGRKRHLQSLSHRKAKALWLNSFVVPNDSNIASSTAPRLCNRFITTVGFCQYGDSGKYFHPNNNNNNNNNPPRYYSITAAPGSLVSDAMGTSRGNLPPSLIPPPEGGYPALPALPFVDWG